MLKLLHCFIQYARYNNAGKRLFIEKIKEWSSLNLSSFEVSTQKNFLTIDFKETAKIIGLFINTILLFYILQTISIHWLISNIIFILVVYIIQFRMIFLFLSILLPSNNIILSKQSNNKTNNVKEIIICAHYDTKNSMFKTQKGKIKSFFKYNIYGISRLICRYIMSLEKLLAPLFVFIYFIYFLKFFKDIQTAFLLLNYPQMVTLFSYNISITLISCSLICTLFILLTTFSFYKEVKNPAADDNTSGVVAALEVAKRLEQEHFDFNIKIVLFDNEEKGLVGSNHFVTKNLNLLKDNNSKVINLDCIGRGKNICINTDKVNNNTILNDIASTMKKKNIYYQLANVDFSDHKPFLKQGIDAISIGRYNCKKYLWLKSFPVIDWIHGSEDSIENIDLNKIQEVVDVVTQTIKNK